MTRSASRQAAWVLDGALVAGVLSAAVALLAWQWLPAQVEPVPWRRAAWGGVLAGAWLAWAGWNWLGAHRAAQAEAAVAGTTAPGTAPVETLLVVFASQTGDAEQLAKQTVATLIAAGTPARAVALHTLDAEALQRAGRALFIVSTTGEGDAPDEAVEFVDTVMTGDASLASFRYGLLALGDSSYRYFCGFGRRLRAWLNAHGAEALFDPIEVDDLDDDALQRWQQQLATLGAGSDVVEWRTRTSTAWRLAARELINPGCVEHACYVLRLEPPAGDATTWIAGDVAEVTPRHGAAAVAARLTALGLDGDVVVNTARGAEPLREVMARSAWPAASAVVGHSVQALADNLRALPRRDYSIASLPADGAIELLVRQMRDAAGAPGLGSGWLTTDAAIGAEVDVRLRVNNLFRVPPPGTPLILIGNGTGLAGLRALLKTRIAAGERRNWLLFGERHRAHDVAWMDELEAWQRKGWLEALDFAFSRDAATRVHVQDVLCQRAGTLRVWLAAGAALRVCGSRDSMGRGVEQALEDLLGLDGVAALTRTGRYRRDVY